jgi:hypothetical protein
MGFSALPNLLFGGGLDAGRLLLQQQSHGQTAQQQWGMLCGRGAMLIA